VTSLELETARLRLRRWRSDDLDAFARITADPEVMRYMLRGPLSREEAQERIEGFEDQRRERGLGHWAVEERDSGALLGGIGLLHHEDWPEDPDNVEVGWLLERTAWGRGLATE
jgi:RimJ/RimL family protein N-acetyltransferase